MTEIDRAEAMIIARAENLTGVPYAELTAPERAYRDDIARKRAVEKDAAAWLSAARGDGGSDLVDGDAGAAYVEPTMPAEALKDW